MATITTGSRIRVSAYRATLQGTAYGPAEDGMITFTLDRVESSQIGCSDYQAGGRYMVHERQCRAVAACPKCGVLSEYSGTVAWCACSGWI